MLFTRKIASIEEIFAQLVEGYRILARNPYFKAQWIRNVSISIVSHQVALLTANVLILESF